MTDAEMRVRALARWEGEGGALAETGTADSMDPSEIRILARLGAALLDGWGDLSPAMQAKLLHSVTTPGGLGDRARVKKNLGDFLYEHRDQC
jgi:hypothetical protein